MIDNSEFLGVVADEARIRLISMSLVTMMDDLKILCHRNHSIDKGTSLGAYQGPFNA